MTEGPTWDVPSSMPPPPPTYGPPPAAPTMPPPVPGTGMQSRLAPLGPTPAVAAYPRPDKSLGVSYVLWLFLGLLGVHHFYLGKWQRGLWYLFTCGLFTVGFMVDVFTLPWQVKRVNAERRAGLR